MSERGLDLSPDALARYAISVPRYTSYPTVPEWTAQPSALEVREHFDRELESPPPLSLYVHIPFCMRLCLYCGCNIVITQNRSRAAVYLDHLEHELNAVAQTALGRRDVVQMHWGGGTPTYLAHDELSRLMHMIRSRFHFTAGAEIGIEVDPRETPPAKVEHLASLGFNRMSMGVQDFAPDVQKAVQRVQPEDMTRATFDTARAAGLRGLNIDLMYGLPLQTVAKFERTLAAVIDMRPDRIALFHYAHLPQMIKGQKGIDESQLPSSSEKLAIFGAAVGMLAAAGYEFIGLDHFALPDDELARARRDATLNRGFQGYTTHREVDLVGFGVSAISNVGRLYVQNKKELGDYQATVARDGLAPMRGAWMTAEDLLRRDVIYRLMCHGKLAKRAVSADHGIDFERHFAIELVELDRDRADGLVRLDGDQIELTPMGVLFMRNVARRFDAYLRQKSGASTFSKSV
jgi:oxygen-independent coproporphyrinogen III oxidase